MSQDVGGAADARSPLRALLAHDARACVRLLEQSAREPPFAGPLGKQNRLRVARALLQLAPSLQVRGEGGSSRVFRPPITHCDVSCLRLSQHFFKTPIYICIP